MPYDSLYRFRERAYHYLGRAHDATSLQHLIHNRIPEELNPGEGDRLIIYYAGHGFPRSNDDGPEGYLVPHDADPTKPELCLAVRDVSEALSKLKCHYLLVILDSEPQKRDSLSKIQRSQNEPTFNFFDISLDC